MEKRKDSRERSLTEQNVGLKGAQELGCPRLQSPKVRSKTSGKLLFLSLLHWPALHNGGNLTRIQIVVFYEK